MGEVVEVALRVQGMLQKGKSHLKCLLDMSKNCIKKWGCGRDNIGAYDIPEARSARLSTARSSRLSEVHMSQMGHNSRVRVRQRHCYDMTRLYYYVALIQGRSVKGMYLRTMACCLAWVQCLRRLIYRDHPVCRTMLIHSR